MVQIVYHVALLSAMRHAAQLAFCELSNLAWSCCRYDSDSTFKTGYLGETPTTIEDERERRIAMWRERLHLASFDSAWDPTVDRYYTTGFGGERWLTPGDPAVLDELGQKLLGLRSWD